MEEDKRQSFVTCSCGTHAVAVSSYKDENDHDVFLSFWGEGWTSSGKMPWKYRLGAIWRIINRGYEFNDSVVLNPREAQALVEALQNHTK